MFFLVEVTKDVDVLKSSGFGVFSSIPFPDRQITQIEKDESPMPDTVVVRVDVEPEDIPECQRLPDGNYTMELGHRQNLQVFAYNNSGDFLGTDRLLVDPLPGDFEPGFPSGYKYICRNPNPLGFASGDFNLYSYIMGEPINLFDPTGLSAPWWIHKFFGNWTNYSINSSAGFGDALLLGFGPAIRDFLGIRVDPCSTAYKVGSWSAFGLGALRLAYAAGAKVISIFAPSGEAAKAGRNLLKTLFRSGIGKGWRAPNLSGLSDEAVRASAGRTNFFLNLYGGSVTAAGAAGGLELPGD